MPAKPITVLCPNLLCRALLEVPESTRGKKVRCSHCGTAFLVPQKPTTEQDDKSEPAPASKSSKS